MNLCSSESLAEAGQVSTLVSHRPAEQWQPQRGRAPMPALPLTKGDARCAMPMPLPQSEDRDEQLMMSGCDGSKALLGFATANHAPL